VGGKGRKHGQAMKKRFEDCEAKIKALRNKNNELQKQCDNELEGDILEAIRSQTAFLEVPSLPPSTKSRT
jgi:chaperonin cofactor prefoldin